MIPIEHKIALCGFVIECAVRIIPTKRNLSFIDLIKRIADLLPNKKKNGKVF